MPFTRKSKFEIAGPAPAPAVNVTLVPEQTGLALTIKVGVGNGFTVMAIVELVTGQAGTLPVVAITSTTSPFTIALDV